MTEQLDPHEVLTDRPQPKEPTRVAIARIVGELVVLADDLTTMLELTDVDSAIMYLRHLGMRLAPATGVIIPKGDSDGTAATG